MKKFKWRLQQVLDVKIKQEQLKRGELLELTERLASKRSELLMRRHMLEALLTKIGRLEPQERLGRQELFLKHCVADDEQVRRLKDEIAALEQEQKKKIDEVLKIRRFRESLERLRAEAEQRYVREQERIEQKQADERAALACARNDRWCELPPRG